MEDSKAIETLSSSNDNDSIGTPLSSALFPASASLGPRATSPDQLYDPLLSAAKCFDSGPATLDYSNSTTDRRHEDDLLSNRLDKELGSAAAASLLVSPLVSIIDRCIVKEPSGVASFVRSMGRATRFMLKEPMAFVFSKSFRLTFLVYFGTFAVANCSDLALDWHLPEEKISQPLLEQQEPASKAVHDDPMRRHAKVAASAVAHIGLMGWRDSVFAREFSPQKAAKSLPPLRTLGLFALRDASKIYATFAAVPLAAAYLHRNLEVDPHAAELSMALALPVLSQVVSAPLHIHAMDVYLRPTTAPSTSPPMANYYSLSTVAASRASGPTIGVADRWATVRAEFSAVALARGLRILPALGIGSYSNNRFREIWCT